MEAIYFVHQVDFGLTHFELIFNGCHLPVVESIRFVIRFLTWAISTTQLVI